MGIFTMGDLAGNDVEYNIRRELGLVRDPKTGVVGPNRPDRYTELGDDLVAKLGRLGQQVGKVRKGCWRRCCWKTISELSPRVGLFFKK